MSDISVLVFVILTLVLLVAAFLIAIVYPNIIKSAGDPRRRLGSCTCICVSCFDAAQDLLLPEKAVQLGCFPFGHCYCSGFCLRLWVCCFNPYWVLVCTV